MTTQSLFPTLLSSIMHGIIPASKLSLKIENKVKNTQQIISKGKVFVIHDVDQKTPALRPSPDVPRREEGRMNRALCLAVDPSISCCNADGGICMLKWRVEAGGHSNARFPPHFQCSLLASCITSRLARSRNGCGLVTSFSALR